MDSRTFPKEVGGDLANRTFLDILIECPKIVEFVDTLWVVEKTTGIFKDFYEYIKFMLQNPLVKIEHQERARAFVKTVAEDKIPSYMKKFCSSPRV